MGGMIFQNLRFKGLVLGLESCAAKICAYANIGILCFLVFVLTGLIAVNQYILHAFMNSADEHSCLFLAECLRLGKWWVPTHPLQEFFDVVHVGNRGGKWFSVYPPGWPILLAVGLKFQIQDWINPILSVGALGLLFLTGRKIFGTSVTWIALLLTALTPFFAFTSAAYYSHSTCLFTMAFFCYAYGRWKDCGGVSQRLLWGALMALAIGYGLMTRYLTMAFFAAPFLICHFWPVLRKQRKMQTGDWVMIGILAGFMTVIYYQNYTVSGNLFKAPNRYDKSWERLGFMDDYTPLDATIYVFARFFYLMDWAPPLFPILFLLSLFQKRTWTVEQRFFQWAFFSSVIAYFFYFSWGGNQYGPRYYYEGFPFLVFSMVDGLRCWWKEGKDSQRQFLAGVLILSLGTAVYQFYKQGRFYEEVSRQRKALYALAEQEIRNPAIVFIRGQFLGQTLVMSRDDAIRNHPLLKGKILYARDLEEKNESLKAFFPARDYYLGSYDRAALKAVLEKLP